MPKRPTGAKLDIPETYANDIRAGEADAVRLGQGLQPCRNVHALTEQVPVFRHHIAEVDPDAKAHATILGQFGIVFLDRTLDCDRPTDDIGFESIEEGLTVTQLPSQRPFHGKVSQRTKEIAIGNPNQGPKSTNTDIFATLLGPSRDGIGGIPIEAPLIQAVIRGQSMRCEQNRKRT